MLYIIQNFTKGQARNAVDIKTWKTVLNARDEEGFMKEMGQLRIRWVRRTF